MPTAPWQADHELTAPEVAALLASRHPELAGAPVRFLNEGWDSRAFAVDGAWVFRFPKRADVRPWLAREARLLPAIARLAAPLAVPQFRYACLEGEPRCPHGYVGYRVLSGVTAMAFDAAPPAAAPAVDADRAADTLGAFLARLHAFPLAVAEQAGVPRADPAGDVAEMREDALACLPVVERAAGPALASRVRAWLQREGARITGAFAGTPVLLHNDLAAEHVVLDPARAEVTGVIDWGDMSIGDPAADFAGIATWLGARGVTRALAHYDARPRDPTLVARACLRGVCVGVANVHYGVEAARDEYVRTGLATLARLVLVAE